MSDRQARALIGKVVEIKAAAFIFNGEVCTAPSYERASQSLANRSARKGMPARLAWDRLILSLPSTPAALISSSRSPVSSSFPGTATTSMR